MIFGLGFKSYTVGLRVFLWFLSIDGIWWFLVSVICLRMVCFGRWFWRLVEVVSFY